MVNNQNLSLYFRQISANRFQDAHSRFNKNKREPRLLWAKQQSFIVFIMLLKAKTKDNAIVEPAHFSKIRLEPVRTVGSSSLAHKSNYKKWLHSFSNRCTVQWTWGKYERTLKRMLPSHCWRPTEWVPVVRRQWSLRSEAHRRQWRCNRVAFVNIRCKCKRWT